MMRAYVEQQQSERMHGISSILYITYNIFAMVRGFSIFLFSITRLSMKYGARAGTRIITKSLMKRRKLYLYSRRICHLARNVRMVRLFLKIVVCLTEKENGMENSLSTGAGDDWSPRQWKNPLKCKYINGIPYHACFRRCHIAHIEPYAL